jgi:hypothetical protein
MELEKETPVAEVMAVEKTPEIPPPTATTVVAQPTEEPIASAASATGVDLDEEFARMLQEQEFSENGGNFYQDKSSYYTPDYTPSTLHFSASLTPLEPSTNFTPIKPPSMAELTKQDLVTKETDYDPEIVCLICHQSPKDYIILPSCQQPHVYCMQCSNKMLNNTVQQTNRYRNYSTPRKSRNGQQSLQCVLCSSISYLDNLNSLRRRKKRKVETMSKCPIHGEEFCLYCTGNAHGRYNKFIFFYRGCGIVVCDVCGSFCA